MKATDLMNNWFENSKAAMAPARELSTMTQRMLERLGEQQMAMTKEYMDLSLRGLQLVSAARDPRTLVNEQVNLAKELGDQMLANAESYAKLATETQAEFAAWAEKTTEAAVAKAEQAVEKAA
jgi:phasin family protein